MEPKAFSSFVETNCLKRLDVMPWSQWHQKLVFILGTGWIFDAFESAISTSSIGQISLTFSIANGSIESGLITAIWPFGGFIGSIFFGYFCDQFGRKVTFLSTLFLYSISTVITAASPNFYMFLLFRAITAIGVVGEYSAVTATISEFVPLKVRGRITTLVIGLFGVGGILASALNYFVYQLVSPRIGWRITFCCPALAALFVLYARRELPESPRFLIGKGRVKEAEDIVDSIASICNEKNGKRISAVLYEKKPPVSIFKQIGTLIFHHPLRTCFACLLDMSHAFGGYGVSSFLYTTLLPLLHVPITHYPLFALVGFSSALIGSIAISMITDQVGRKKIIPLCYLGSAVTSFLIYPALKSGNLTLVYISFGVYSAVYTSAWNSAFTLYAELFPTNLRSTGIGLAVACGRLGGALSPILLPIIFQTGPDQHNYIGAFSAISSFFLVTCLASIPWAIWGVEGAGKSLEDLQ